MRIPRFIEKVAFGRQDFHEDRQQPVGTWAHPVPFIRQRHTNMCGDACVLMLASYYYGTDALSEETRNVRGGINMKKNPRGPIDGLDLPGPYANFLDNVFLWQEAGTVREKLIRHLEDYPMIVGGDFCNMGILGEVGHWVVLKGRSDEGGSDQDFYIHDPWHGANIKVPQQAFALKVDVGEVFAVKPSLRDKNEILLKLANRSRTTKLADGSRAVVG
jgi:Papain-like cysteine protease AvrRpt2